MKIHFAIALLVISFANPAASQSIGETVVYMVTGADPNSEIESEYVRSRYDLESVDERSMRLVAKQSKDIFIDVDFPLINECQIEMNLNIGNYKNELKKFTTEKAEISIDMYKVHEVRLVGGYVQFVGVRASCSEGSDGQICKQSVMADGTVFQLFNFGNSERIKKAYKYYRSRYCIESAF